MANQNIFAGRPKSIATCQAWCRTPVGVGSNHVFELMWLQNPNELPRLLHAFPLCLTLGQWRTGLTQTSVPPSLGPTIAVLAPVPVGPPLHHPPLVCGSRRLVAWAWHLGSAIGPSSVEAPPAFEARDSMPGHNLPLGSVAPRCPTAWLREQRCFLSFGLHVKSLQRVQAWFVICRWLSP